MLDFRLRPAYTTDPMKSERREIQVERFSAEQLASLSVPVLQVIHTCLANRDLDAMNIKWRSHFYYEWPPGGDLVIKYA